MEQTATHELLPTSDAEFETAIGRLIAEMKQIREQMAADQHDIEIMRTETRVILNRMKTA